MTFASSRSAVENDVASWRAASCRLSCTQWLHACTHWSVGLAQTWHPRSTCLVTN